MEAGRVIEWERELDFVVEAEGVSVPELDGVLVLDGVSEGVPLLEIVPVWELDGVPVPDLEGVLV